MPEMAIQHPTAQHEQHSAPIQDVLIGCAIAPLALDDYQQHMLTRLRMQGFAMGGCALSLSTSMPTRAALSMRPTAFSDSYAMALTFALASVCSMRMRQLRGNQLATDWPAK